ncbi:recombinase family protein [Sediminivirga luteola]|jgi:DNA invertase Pin-like site-specific DNA recombinase|uniref:recombinase family protein n=1 Tax=Sediminivirga luteola TaxID=1774748 RepID=UPI001F5A6765|nr:recombinase family protein [Sediminivirga luteola]MCI2266368.1 recombinase family protein [Sediminivirga luteola]
MTALTYRRSATLNPSWLESQDAECRTYAREHGLTITDTFTDIDRTGDGLADLLEAAQSDSVDAVIVTDLARFGTKITDHITTVQRLHDAGVEIHVVREPTTNTPDAIGLTVAQSYAEADTKLDYPLGGNGPGN